ncbi:unnamed protein product [Mytilus coruscus]|uniref:Uncharacterized protein n=1 Tax=Mytilus coruscus TaxID=42192 RepID=A0A6J8BMH4_MYTCO|nr:unnamed protein product [Mytilus coruscus]
MYLTKEAWLHTFQIDIPRPREIHISKLPICSYKNYSSICSSMNSMRHFIQHLHDSMEHDLKETIQAIKILVPQTKLFESSRNGRAILPFIGSMAKGLFGLATMSDVQLLANHINALNAKSRSITQALQQHSDHLSSFVKVIDKRTSNLMQGIKDNSLEIQTIAHSFQLAIVSSEQSMHDYYLPLSTDDLTNCVHGPIVFCTFNKALIPITVPDCSLALFQNNVKQVSRLCNFRFLENHLSHDIIELTPTSVLVYDSEELDLVCPQSQRKIPGCTFCVINIPCKCSLSTRKLYFSPRLVDCYESSSNFSILHPVNLALVQEFFDEKQFTSLLADSLFTTPVQLAIPDFSFYNHSMSKILAADANTQLSLKKIAVAAKKDKMIFKTLTEPLLSGDISLQSSWLDTNTIVSFCSLGIAILSLFAFAFLFCKTRKIAMTMTIMQQMSHTKSQSVPSFIYVKPTQLPQTEQDDIMNRVKSFFSSEFSWATKNIRQVFPTESVENLNIDEFYHDEVSVTLDNINYGSNYNSDSSLPDQKLNDTSGMEAIDLTQSSPEKSERRLKNQTGDAGSQLIIHEAICISTSSNDEAHGQLQMKDIESSESEEETPKAFVIENGKRKLPHSIFNNVAVERVKFVPEDINGTKKYQVPIDSNDKFKYMRDERNWGRFKPSKRAGFFGIRYIQDCKGYFECRNNSCPFLEEYVHTNKIHFRPFNSGKDMQCEQCGEMATKVDCNARKITEIDRSEKCGIIYHFGFHDCPLKKASVRKISKGDIEGIFKQDNTKKPCIAGSGLVKQAIYTDSTWENIETLAEGSLDSEFYKNCTKKVLTQMFPHGHNIDAVKHLKEKTDEKDKFLIYKVTDDIVFKTSDSKLCFLQQMK